MKLFAVKSKRRWLGVLLLILSLAFAVGSMPMQASAEDATALDPAKEGLWVNGTDITKASDYTVRCGNGVAGFDPATNTLTLKEAQIASDGIKSFLDTALTIQIEGSGNSITSTAKGISSVKKITLKSTGTEKLRLTINSVEDGIYCPTLDCQNVILDVEHTDTEATAKAISLFDETPTPPDSTIQQSNITISGYPGGSIVQDSASAKDVVRKLTIRDSEITVENCSNSELSADALVINNSKVDIEKSTGGSSEDSKFLYGKKSLQIQNKSDVTITTDNSPALSNAEGGSMEITDSKVTAISDDAQGIYSQGTLQISGTSEVKAVGTTSAIESKGSMTLDGPAVINAEATDGIGIFSETFITMNKGLELVVKVPEKTSAIEVQYTKQSGDKEIEPKIVCDPSLIPGGYKIGTSENWIETTDKKSAYSRTSFIPYEQEFLENDKPGFGGGEFKLKDAARPIITEDLKSEEIKYNQGQPAAPLQIKAEVGDGGTLSYQWYATPEADQQKAELIEGATEPSYTPQTKAVRTMYYFCVVTNTNNNAVGDKTTDKASSFGRITVVRTENAAKPEITQDLAGGTITYIKDSTASALSVSAKLSDGGTLQYQWYSNTIASVESGKRIHDATSSSYIPPTETIGQMYYYCVITNKNNYATSDKEAEAKSNIVKIVVTGAPDAERPHFTQNLKTSEIILMEGDGIVPLKVQAVIKDGGELTYQWYSDTEWDPGYGDPIKGATTNTYRPPTDKAGTRYYYCVATNYNKNAVGVKTVRMVSNIAKVTIYTPPAVPKVTVSGTYNSVKVSWKGAERAVGYQVYRCPTKDGSYIKLYTTRGKTWTNKNLTAGKVYYYKVRSYNYQDDRTIYSDFSAPIKVTIRTKAPIFRLTAGDNRVKVSWNTAAGASGYQVYRATSKTGKYKLVKDMRGSRVRTYTNTKLSNKRTYYYKMRTYRIVKGKKVYSLYSSVKSAKTK